MPKKKRKRSLSDDLFSTRPKRKKQPKRNRSTSAPAYQAKKEDAAERQAEASAAGRDIGEIPPVVNPDRRIMGSESFEFFCRVYFPDVFSWPWSNDHRRVIDRIEQAVRTGSLYAIAMPRGSGKSCLAEKACIWALINGYRQYVVFVGSDKDAASQCLDSVKTELENNDLLLEDFPEICYPIRALEGISNRCKGQLCGGTRTYIIWTAEMVVLPTIAGSVASGGILRVKGIEGGIRGLKYARPGDGKNVRPDLVVPDDPQTDASARSVTDTRTRVGVLRKAVLGLAGPGKAIAGVMPCTVIERGDLADQFLDRKKHPEWQGERTKLVYAWPTNEELWKRYLQIRADGMRAGNGEREATEFYRANREAMDAGSDVAWASRFKPDEISAIQHAFNLRADVGDEAFAAEYQNEPLLAEQNLLDLLTAEQIAAKINNRARGIVPFEATKLCAFIDVQKNGFPWAVGSFEPDFTGTVVDYGFWPEQGDRYFSRSAVKRTAQLVLKSKSMEETVYQGLRVLTGEILGREWKRDGGPAARIDRCLIDFGWGDFADVVVKFCQESAFAAQLVPSKGFGVGASSVPFNEYKKHPGDEVGDHWRRPAATKRNVRHVLFDSNYFKSFAMERWAVPMGGRGCLSIFGTSPDEHQMFADHQVSEYGVPTTAKGRTVTEWKLKPSRPDNDLLDCVVGLHVAAAMGGVMLEERAKQPVAPRKKFKLSERIKWS